MWAGFHSASGKLYAMQAVHQFNFNEVRRVLGGNDIYPACYTHGNPATFHPPDIDDYLSCDGMQVLRFHPKLSQELTKTHSLSELTSILKGLLQLGLLMNRTVVWPDLPCNQTAWMSKRPVVDPSDSIKFSERLEPPVDLYYAIIPHGDFQCQTSLTHDAGCSNKMRALQIWEFEDWLGRLTPGTQWEPKEGFNVMGVVKGVAGVQGSKTAPPVAAAEGLAPSPLAGDSSSMEPAVHSVLPGHDSEVHSESLDPELDKNTGSGGRLHMLTIHDSNILNNVIFNKILRNCTVKDSIILNSTIWNSMLVNSTINGSAMIHCTIDHCIVNDEVEPGSPGHVGGYEILKHHRKPTSSSGFQRSSSSSNDGGGSGSSSSSSRMGLETSTSSSSGSGSSSSRDDERFKSSSSSSTSGNNFGSSSSKIARFVSTSRSNIVRFGSSSSSICEGGRSINVTSREGGHRGGTNSSNPSAHSKNNCGNSSSSEVSGLPQTRLLLAGAESAVNTVYSRHQMLLTTSAASYYPKTTTTSSSSAAAAEAGTVDTHHGSVHPSGVGKPGKPSQKVVRKMLQGDAGSQGTGAAPAKLSVLRLALQLDAKEVIAFRLQHEQALKHVPVLYVNNIVNVTWGVESGRTTTAGAGGGAVTQGGDEASKTGEGDMLLQEQQLLEVARQRYKDALGSACTAYNDAKVLEVQKLFHGEGSLLTEDPKEILLEAGHLTFEQK